MFPDTGKKNGASVFTLDPVIVDLAPWLREPGNDLEYMGFIVFQRRYLLAYVSWPFLCVHGVSRINLTVGGKTLR